MAKRWQKEELAYLKRYGKTKSEEELAVRFNTDKKTILSALAEIGVLTAPIAKEVVAFSRPAPPRPETDPLVQQLTDGLGWLQKQEWKKAAEELEKVIAGDEPSLSARARQFLAICRQKLATEVQEADDPFLEAVMLRNRGAIKDALELSRRGGRDKKDDRFAFLVASIHAAEGRLDEAAKALAQAIELNPRNRVHAFHDVDFAALRRHAEHRQLFELP